MWDNLGRVFAEYPHLDEIWRRTEVVGADIVRGLAAAKTPALFFSAHIGNWEINLMGATRNGLPAPAIAQLAYRYDCAVVPAVVERLEGTRFRLTISPPLELGGTGDKEADIRSLMSRINGMIEDWERARPEQWLWLHRRWPD
jgi:lauroyl/myristoyl acyltransferase